VEPSFEPPKSIKANELASDVPSSAPTRSKLPGSDGDETKCSAHPACSALSGDCCPTIDGVFLTCCHGIRG
jgi:hypothetical protein